MALHMNLSRHIGNPAGRHIGNPAGRHKRLDRLSYVAM